MTDHPPFRTVDDLYDRMYGDARTNHVTETAMNAQTREGLREARDALSQALAAGITTQADLARRTGLKETAISEFKNDAWKGAAGALAHTAQTVAKAINEIYRELEAAESEVGGFQMTRMAEAIFSIAKYCAKRGKIGVIVAPAGNGKSICLQALLEEFPGSVRLTITREEASPFQFLRLLCAALRLKPSGGAAVLHGRITKALKGTRRLILIDEAHKLRVAALDVMREIWDATRVPILMAATPVLYETITRNNIGGAVTELMDQLSSRVSVYRDLTHIENPETGEPGPRHSVADIRKIYERGRVRLAPDGAELLSRIANHNGGGNLRRVNELVQLIVDMFPGRLIDRAIITKALATQVGVHEAGLFVEQVDDRAEAPRKVASRA